jgi:hypothetical protein
MRRTRWAVFTRMNELEGGNARRTEQGSAEREWSVRVLPADHNPAFTDGVVRESLRQSVDGTAAMEKPEPER